MAFGKKTDRAGLQAVLELKNVDYSKDPEIQQLYTRLVNGRSQFGQILAKNASASLQIAEVVDALKDYNSKMESVSGDRTGIGGRYEVCVRKFACGRGGFQPA